MRPVLERVAGRVLRATLLLYGREFRSRFGQDAVQLGVDNVRRAGAIGRVAALLALVRTLTDLVRAAPRDWLHASGHAPEVASLGARLGEDLAFALRRARRSPIRAASIVLAAALGAGASTAVFAVVETLFLDPLPLQDGARIVRVYGVDTRFGSAGGVSWLNVRDLADASEMLERVAVFHGAVSARLLVGEPMSVPVAEVGPGFVETLGVTPVLARRVTSPRA